MGKKGDDFSEKVWYNSQNRFCTAPPGSPGGVWCVLVYVPAQAPAIVGPEKSGSPPTVRGGLIGGHMPKAHKRPDKDGTQRLAFERAKKKIYATQTVCGICGRPVDFSQKYPHPMSPCIDHIIPIAKGGHPSDLDNLQLAHWTCNRQKSDKILRTDHRKMGDEVLSNRVLPQSCNWAAYRSK